MNSPNQVPIGLYVEPSHPWVLPRCVQALLGSRCVFLCPLEVFLKFSLYNRHTPTSVSFGLSQSSSEASLWSQRPLFWPPSPKFERLVRWPMFSSDDTEFSKNNDSMVNDTSFDEENGVYRFGMIWGGMIADWFGVLCICRRGNEDWLIDFEEQRGQTYVCSARETPN